MPPPSLDASSNPKGEQGAAGGGPEASIKKRGFQGGLKSTLLRVTSIQLMKWTETDGNGRTNGRGS